MKNLLCAAASALPAIVIAGAIAPVAADTGPAHGTVGSGHRSVTELGRSTTKKAGLTMAFSRTVDGITAKCGAAARTAVPGAGSLPGIPLARPTDYRVPMRDPSAVLLMNKQIGDPFGGTTTTGMSLDAAPGTPGAVPRVVSGAANCDALRQAGRLTRQDRFRPVLSRAHPVTSLSAPSLR